MILLLLVVAATVYCGDEHVIPEFKRGPILLVDETALSNPNSFDYDFSDDLGKPADKQDLYDQFIDQLPMFHLYKLGKDKGVTQVPIVTRGWGTWFTPSTLSNREEKFTFYATTPMTTKNPTTKAPTTLRSTTQRTTTTRPVTTTTMRSTTERPTTTTTTTTQQPKTTRHQRRPFVPRQPSPVFRTSTTTTTTTQAPFNRGPIWRKGGVVFQTTTTTRQPTTPRMWTVRGFRVRSTTTTTTTTTQPPTTTTTTQAPRTTSANRWVAGPRHPPRFNQNWRQPIRTLQQSLGRTVPPTHSDPISRALPKPVVIQSPTHSRYAGPTYNCRVLNPFTDGTASNEHDPSCQMLYPGLSMDGSCRCFYKVAGRDSHGCATGFIYACRAISLRSISV